MESVKRTAALDNEHGKIAQKFGMKILIHNHTAEFSPIADNPSMKPYDILLAETDPSLVSMQMDIGWASVAGQDILAMFKKNPGRYELWHVKDSAGIPNMNAQMSQAERMTAADIVPVGMGVVDRICVPAGPARGSLSVIDHWPHHLVRKIDRCRAVERGIHYGHFCLEAAVHLARNPRFDNFQLRDENTKR